jgi:hypothetical protein
MGYNGLDVSPAGGDIHVAHRFPALIAAPDPEPGRLWLTGVRLFDGTGTVLRDPGRIWLVLRQGTPVAGQAFVHRAP